MSSRGLLLINAIQAKLPYAKVFWRQAPDQFFEDKECTLVAVSQEDPKKRVEMRYKDGLENHTIKTLADDFVAHVGSMYSD